MKINLVYAVCSVILSILLINDTYAKPTVNVSGVEVDIKVENLISNENNNNNETNANLESMDTLVINTSNENSTEIQTEIVTEIINETETEIINETETERVSNIELKNEEEINVQNNRVENTSFEHLNNADKNNYVNLNDEKSIISNLNATLSIDETENKISDDAIDDDEDHLNRVKYAKKMITFMNQSIDPCDDFYEYACGNWKNTLVARQSPHKRNNLLDIGFELADMVQKLLEEPAENLRQKYADELRQARIFYQSCLEADLQPQTKSEAYLEIIRNISGFPAVDGEIWNSEDFSWFNTSAYLSNYGGGGFINEDIVPQYPFPPYFKLPELGFDLIVHSDNISTNATRGYMLNEKRMRDYLTTYGVKEPKISETIASVFELWHAILDVIDEFHEDVGACRELGSAENITEWSPWNEYFNLAWEGINFEDSISDCPCPYLYTKIDEICNERKEATANYLAMKFLFRMDARLEDKKFQREFCNLKVKSSLQFLIDKFYMAEHFHPEIRTEVSEITKEVQSVLRKTLEKLDWLDDETRKEALEKESSIQTRIGIFENNELMDRLIREMRNLTFDQTNYEKNNIEITKFRQSLKRFIGLHHKELSEEIKPLELLIGMQVNAFYYNIDNSINVMAGILHPPAYHRSWPFSLKYGTLGYLIGHEFTHGFDTVGAFYDKNGDEKHWWSEKSETIFEERTNCYIEKFNEYTIPEIMRNIDGNLTKDENIADNGGLRNALSAYQNYIKGLSNNEDQTKMSILKEEYMPGLDLTPEQLFFLGFAQLWCSDYKEEHFWEELTNQHTIDKYRVLGTISNMDDFAKAYNCPIGSRMNPNPDKCVLW